MRVDLVPLWPRRRLLIPSSTSSLSLSLEIETVLRRDLALCRTDDRLDVEGLVDPSFRLRYVGFGICRSFNSSSEESNMSDILFLGTFLDCFVFRALAEGGSSDSELSTDLEVKFSKASGPFSRSSRLRNDTWLLLAIESEQM